MTRVVVQGTREQLVRRAPPTLLDELPGIEEATEIEVYGYAVLRRPLPGVRRFRVVETDDETLANLPAVEHLCVRRGLDRTLLDATRVHAGLVVLETLNAFGGAALGRFAATLRELTAWIWAAAEVKPVGQLLELRRLDLALKNGAQHLARLERLEDVTLDFEGGNVADLRRFRGWTAVEQLALSGGALKSVAGDEGAQRGRRRPAPAADVRQRGRPPGHHRRARGGRQGRRGGHRAAQRQPLSRRAAAQNRRTDVTEHRASRA